MGSRGQTGVLPLLLIAAGLVLSSCGSAATVTATTGPRHPRRADAGAVTTRGVTTGAVTTRRTKKTAGTPVGANQDVPAPGTTLVVRVTKVTYPLLGSGATIQAHQDVVGVFVFARNAGPGSYDSSATSDFSLLSAAGLATPVYVPSGTCHTYDQNFMNEIGAGQARTGCVAFAVPRGRAPTTVRFSPDGGTAGVVRSWEVQ